MRIVLTLRPVNRAIDPTEAQTVYYSQPRPEMLPFVPADAKRVMELGCAEGAFAASIKERNGAEVWGLEFNPDAGEQAQAVLDRVLVGDAGARIAELADGYFDAIICNDVLEHLVEPGAILEQLRPKLAPGGVVVASIPNIRYLPALSQVVFRKDFPQEECGIFDRTHLRFFTHKSIVRLFEGAGYTLREMQGINKYYGTTAILLSLLSFGYFSDCRYLQYACVASPSS
jgi:2-polyprenyl-3-methyl-5-hydroxy-6-metoxy-1,4-benzoquinol methylase